VPKGPYTSGKAPSAWAIVLVAAALILLPSLLCAGILITSSSGPQPTHEGLKIEKRQDAKP